MMNTINIYIRLSIRIINILLSTLQSYLNISVKCIQETKKKKFQRAHYQICFIQYDNKYIIII